VQGCVLAGTVVLTSLATGRSVTIPARWGTRLETGLDPVAPRLWSAATFADAISHTEVRYAHTGQGRNVNAAARGRERLLIGAREIEEACRPGFCFQRLQFAAI
jgi:hypothetical protein